MSHKWTVVCMDDHQCATCKHQSVENGEEPCETCIMSDSCQWEPKDEPAEDKERG